MVRNFKGVVKVADVQAEFDNLLNAINDKIDTYNSSLNVEDVDYNNGGSDLAAYGYTLSVGGLKTALDAYDGAILGANVLRVSNNRYIVSEGLYIKNRSVRRLPSKVLTGNGKTVYYNESANSYTFGSQGSSRLYPNEDNNVVVTPGTYPLTIYDIEAQSITNTTVTFNSPQIATKYISNTTINKMQNSSYKVTTYASFSQQYDYASLTPDCLLDPTSPQYNDVYNSSLIGRPDTNRDDFTVTVPMDLNFGSRYIYGVKVEIDVDEPCASGQTLYISKKYIDASDYSSFYYWKIQLFAYDENGNLLANGPINTGYQYSSYATVTDLPSSTKKIIVCAIAPYTMYMISSLNSNLDIRISNAEMINYVNADRNCTLAKMSDESTYYIENYNESFNTLLGVAHFTPNTNDLAYITLSNGGGGEVSNNLLISKINNNRISRLCNRPNATNESIPGYKMTIESKSSGYVYNGNQTLSNSAKGQFFSGSAGRNCSINLLGTQVAYHHWGNDRSDSYHEPINFLFVPKGLPNPYSGLAGETVFAMQKVFNYILKRPNR